MANWHRWYDPKRGRYLSQDLLGEIGAYPYAGANPITNIDPLGLMMTAPEAEPYIVRGKVPEPEHTEDFMRMVWEHGGRYDDGVGVSAGGDGCNNSSSETGDETTENGPPTEPCVENLPGAIITKRIAYASPANKPCPNGQARYDTCKARFGKTIPYNGEILELTLTDCCRAVGGMTTVLCGYSRPPIVIEPGTETM